MPGVLSRWESLLLMLWWRRLGVDLLMKGRLADQITLARALLDHEEEPDYEAEEEDRAMRRRAAHRQRILKRIFEESAGRVLRAPAEKTRRRVA